ncbi:MAG: ABC transporter permease subunit [Ethanoligenens sp.]|uniref:ABC transporter permease subunit n=1 Tax=Ethanoligenens sp. TaxID=2099655 RepID=UPI0039E9333B
MSAIFKRELHTYFTTASGYVFLAVFYALSGFFLFSVNLAGSTTNLGGLFSALLLVWAILIPILTMRLLSEERRQKTDQLLLTAPVRLFDIVFGKFLAALTIFGAGIGIVVIYALVLAGLGRVDFWATVGSFIGIILLGAALISIGLFISSLTENQVVSAVVSFFIMLILYLIDIISSAVNNAVVSAIVTNISIFSRFKNFSLGVFNLGDTVFYISVAALFLFLTVRLLEKRRWA